MASSFLENLKKSVDTGEFNSEAAKKIIEVDKLADNANVENLAGKNLPHSFVDFIWSIIFGTISSYSSLVYCWLKIQYSALRKQTQPKR